MVNSFQFPRTLLVYAIAVPLALILGFFLIAPENLLTWMLVGLLIFVGLLPWMLKSHHKALIIGWNAFVNVFFLPGQPPFWLLLVAMSMGLSLLARIVSGKNRFISAPMLTRPLLFLLATVVFTACMRGGLGIRSLGGSAYGGRYYALLLGAIIGYFALSAQVVSKKEASWLIALYFLSSITAVFSNIAYALGPSFYFLFNFFRADLVSAQVMQDYGGSVFGLDRIEGLSIAASGLYMFLLARYGIRGIFDLKKPWRLLLLAIACVSVLFGGFRSLIIWFILLFALQLYWEKLLRTRLFAALVMVGVLMSVGVVTFIEKMPLTVQRAFSFLPIEGIDFAAREDALASTEWRMEMWRVVVPQIPEYLWVGKGYSIDPTDLFLAEEAVSRGFAKNYDTALIAGDYHSGPLSTIIPLGIWGVIGFVWLSIAGLIALYRNYKYGDPELQRINTFLLAFFAARIIFFIFVFGALNTELFLFTGILGVSVSFNGGVKSKIRSRLAPAPVRGLALGAVPQPA